jgi:hypothetical protein
MTRPSADLAEWCRGEIKAAHEQAELFGAKGVRALLAMPDGTQQDITPNVLSHQSSNIEKLTELLALLES